MTCRNRRWKLFQIRQKFSQTLRKSFRPHTRMHNWLDWSHQLCNFFKHFCNFQSVPLEKFEKFFFAQLYLESSQKFEQRSSMKILKKKRDEESLDCDLFQLQTIKGKSAPEGRKKWALNIYLYVLIVYLLFCVSHGSNRAAEVKRSRKPKEHKTRHTALLCLKAFALIVQTSEVLFGISWHATRHIIKENEAFSSREEM